MLFTMTGTEVGKKVTLGHVKVVEVSAVAPGGKGKQILVPSRE